MTDEQIKQNAEEYADSMKEVRGELEWVATRDDFIAGAHSRDEEINELKAKVFELSKQIDLQDKTINEHDDELFKLRNPWINVENRLPEDDVEVIGITKRGWVFLIRRNSNEWCGTEYRELHCPEITHWMPIPKLEGGAL